jgi:ABC-type Fe3+ transport system substrate-binding protein
MGDRKRRFLQSLRLAVLAAAAVAVVVWSGCGDEGSDSGDDSAASAPPAASKAWQDGGGEKWAKVLDAARAEGEVVIDGPPTLGEGEFAKAFERDTGIELKVSTGESAARQTSNLQEAQANRLSVDLALGGSSELLEMAPLGLLNPIADQLLLPGVTDGSNWKGGKIKWVDEEEEYLLQGSNSKLTAWTAVNADEIDPAEIDSWESLLDPKFKGKIASYDPRTSGVGQALAAAFVWAYGSDFPVALYEGQDVTLSSNSRQLIDWVARGRFPIALGVSPVDVKTYQDQGLNIEVLDPPNGPQFLDGAQSIVKQPRNKDGSLGPHPNAATVFINWFASQPGQLVYNRDELNVSLRTDVPVQPGVDENIVPDEGRKTLDGSSYAFYVEQRPKIREDLTETLGGG